MTSVSALSRLTDQPALDVIADPLSRAVHGTYEAAGDAGMMLGDVDFGEEQVNVLHPFMDCRAFTIYGGSNQIQRNILAKTVLNLPG